MFIYIIIIYQLNLIKSIFYQNFSRKVNIAKQFIYLFLNKLMYIRRISQFQRNLMPQ